VRRAIVKLVVASVITLAAVGTTFVAGMRAKTPLVVNAVRRLGRATRPLAMRTAGTSNTNTTVIRHVGRRSGRTYETPVGAVASDDGFVIALPYGTSADWMKNVLTAGTATIVSRGLEHPVDLPEIVPLSTTSDFFSPADQIAHRLFGVQQALRVRLAPPRETVAGPSGEA
jgi:deazaflavin-dependent oxidoreductase (nitroreductase family)